VDFIKSYNSMKE